MTGRISGCERGEDITRRRSKVGFLVSGFRFLCAETVALSFTGKRNAGIFRDTTSKKLGIKAGFRVRLANAPAEVRAELRGGS